MHFDNRMTVENVCLPVTDPKGMPRLLFGKRYTDGPVAASTPAIVLVHGIASSTANWDFTPTWSVARALASAGYVVLSYDRLGYAKSSYFDQPGGGTTLTTHEHRRMLHEIVGDVKTGAYFTTTSQARGRRAACATRRWPSSAIARAAGSSPAIPGPTTTSPR